MAKPLLDIFLNYKQSEENHAGGEAVRGDIICVNDNLLKRYGVCVGDKVIFCGETKSGERIVREVSFDEFLQGTEGFSVCEFPEKHGESIKWASPAPISGVVMPERNKWGLLERMWRKNKYKRYSREETARRAESQIGSDRYDSSEQFAMWCKTGIAESIEIESMRNLLRDMVVY